MDYPLILFRNLNKDNELSNPVNENFKECLLNLIKNIIDKDFSCVAHQESYLNDN